MKIRQKLIFGFLGVAFLVLVVASISIISFRNVRVIFTEIKKDGETALEELLKKDNEELHPEIRALGEIIEKHKLAHLEELKEADKKVSQVQTLVTAIVLISGILIFCLAIGVGYFISLSISRPIMQLKDAAVKIGKGELGAKVAIRSKDEIGMLAGSFNKMSSDLQDNQKEIQAQNEELRATIEELQQANEDTQNAKEVAEKKAAELERFNKMAVDRELRMRELKEKIKELEEKLVKCKNP